VTGANARVALLAVAIGLPIGVLLLGCDSIPFAPAPHPGPLVTDVVPAGFPAGTPGTRAPADNALTEARAELGRRLFFDKQLSRTHEVACGSCHFIEHAFSDPNAVSTGVEQRVGTRNAPSLANLAWGASFFWDGRARTLEDQAGQPIENPAEMDLPLDEAAARIAADPSYAPAFDAAYAQRVDAGSLRKAIASFVRVLVSADSPYDRHLRGDDGQFGDAERRGEQIFLSEKGGCFHCHPAGPLTNEGYFNNGSYTEGGDPGRQTLTHRTGDLGKFKVPGLRNVAVTAPYMHDGSLATLEDVVDRYMRGGNGNPATDPAIAPLSLSPDERADLLAFLRALTDPTFLSDPRFLAPAAGP
jgi:cytochrome c peroxidase